MEDRYGRSISALADHKKYSPRAVFFVVIHGDAAGTKGLRTLDKHRKTFGIIPGCYTVSRCLDIQSYISAKTVSLSGSFSISWRSFG